MQTIANTFATKALVAVVAAAMIFSAFAAPAKAATAEELQKMINDLMAQMAALQGGSTTTGGSSAAVCPYTWTRDLKTGATGADVKMLQQFLNANADTRVAATGAGSAGMETETFGPATAAAVSKFQVMHRADILTPAGLTNPTGFFGPSTRAKANALCVTSTGGDEDEDEDEEATGDLSGEATLEDASLEDASDDEIEEGAEEEVIAELTVEFADGDASISRLDVKLGVSDATDPWDIFETISLWVDGDMVAEMAADDEDEYQSSDDETLRFSGLDIVAMEDEELEISIGATLQGSIDTADRDAVTISVPSMRYFDADGVAETVSGSSFTTDTASIQVVVAGADDEVIVKTSANDPDATTLKLEDDSKSDWYNVFTFDLDTDDSTNDIELNTVVATVELSSSTYNAIVDDAEIEIDGTTIDDVTVTNGTTNTATLTFDVDGDVTIDAGDRVEAKLMLKFKSLDAGNEGMTVRGLVTSGNRNAIDAEGAEDVTNLEGAATGDYHTLRSTGVDVALDSTSANVTQGDNAGDDYATYKISLDVTAFDQDVFINTDEAVSASTSVVNSSGAAVAGTSTVVIDSSADVEGGSFKIAEGETETVTITVTFDAVTAGAAARLQLNALVFGANDGDDDQTWLALPASTYRTNIVTLVN